MKQSFELIGYLIYLPISIGLTAYVSHQLFKQGKLFMLDIFKQQEAIAFATNKLLKIGFYLLNIGFAIKIVKMYSIHTHKQLIEALCSKIGGFSIYLGIVMLLFLILFLKGRKASRISQKTQES